MPEMVASIPDPPQVKSPPLLLHSENLLKSTYVDLMALVCFVEDSFTTTVSNRQSSLATDFKSRGTNGTLP